MPAPACYTPQRHLEREHQYHNDQHMKTARFVEDPLGAVPDSHGQSGPQLFKFGAEHGRDLARRAIGLHQL